MEFSILYYFKIKHEKSDRNQEKIADINKNKKNQINNLDYGNLIDKSEFAQESVILKT